MTYRRRHVESVVEAALGDTRVVIVSGARQAGKSTVAHRLVRDRPNVVERKLDRPSDLSAARLDPTYFVDHDGLMVIDEIQRAPELMLPIKAAVDVDNRPGQFLLTGSARSTWAAGPSRCPRGAFRDRRVVALRSRRDR